MHGPEALQEVPGAVSGRRESLRDEGALRSLRQRLPAELESPGFGHEIVRLWTECTLHPSTGAAVIPSVMGL